jgi:hypothetical protein
MGAASRGLVIGLRTCGAAVALACSAAQPATAHTVDLVNERSIDDLQTMLRSGKTTSSALVDAYLKRIAQIDKAGPPEQRYPH